jgi:glucokinase
LSILGIDIGGTKSIVGVADESGKLLAHKRILTPNVLGPDINIGMILPAADEVVQQAGDCISAIGIGCGGPLDRKTGTLHAVANLPGWEGICLTEIFSEQFDAPAYLDNDATAAAMGEAMFGAGVGVEDLVYLTVSTGIGGGIIIGGKPYRGCGENAGEFGHAKIVPDGPPCNCGDHGCLESLASGTSIARIARESLAANPKSTLHTLASSPDDITAELVAKAAAQGDEYAFRVWSEAMYHLGLGVANAVNVLNPRLVVIGGGVTKAGDMLFEPVREVVRQRAMKPLVADVEIVPAANGDLVGLMGAFAIAIENRMQWK